MVRILIAEDEKDLAMGLQDNLQFEGYDVLTAGDGEAALRLAFEQRPDAVLLDIMMPKMDGLTVCRRIREAGFIVPILMLTARSQEADIVDGLEMGADDYITKPFNIRELLARIKAVLRRGGSGHKLPKLLRIGESSIDLVKGKVSRGVQSFNLGHFELEILKMLVEHAEKPVERNKLLDVIWGMGDFTPTRTVDNHIVSLRRKIEACQKMPRHIVTVHGVGYKFVP